MANSLIKDKRAASGYSQEQLFDMSVLGILVCDKCHSLRAFTDTAMSHTRLTCKCWVQTITFDPNLLTIVTKFYSIFNNVKYNQWRLRSSTLCESCMHQFKMHEPTNNVTATDCRKCSCSKFVIHHRYWPSSPSRITGKYISSNKAIIPSPLVWTDDLNLAEDLVKVEKKSKKKKISISRPKAPWA